MVRKNLKLFVFALFIIGFTLCAVLYGGIQMVRGSNLVLKNNNNNSLVSSTAETKPTLINREKSIADVIEEVSPGVVTVTVESVVNSYNGTNKVSSIGSGFFIDKNKILTNQHVVLNSTSIKVVLSDGTTHLAKILNADEENDIALLEVTTPGFASSTVLRMGSSDNIRVGETVVAIGSPLNLSFSGTATTGIISGVARRVETKNGVSTYIQTDAAINPGNSGGPLLNSRGEVIGINAAKIDIDGVEGIGFAIPINIAKLKLEELGKEVLTIGIAGVNIGEQNSISFGISSGVFVVEVEKDSFADKLGLIPGDIIIKFNEVSVTSVEQINNLKRNVENQISVGIMRNGKFITLSMQI